MRLSGFAVVKASARLGWSSAFLAAVLAITVPARADLTHVVQRGHTIEAIARRYRITVKSIVEANHLKDTDHLKPGQALTIPGVEFPKKKGGSDRTVKQEHPSAMRSVTAALELRPEPRRADHETRDATSTIHAIRLGEEFRVRVKDAHGHIPPSALKAFERIMRQGNATHAIDPRLVALVGIVSNHFAGKPIEIVSGYRPYTPTQYTPRSNHNYGKAIDFHVAGVSNESLRDFCRTLRSAGCGYYPNDAFVHMDVRETKAYWVDWSQPGQPPRYDNTGVGADEGLSDVPGERAPPAEARPEEPAKEAVPSHTASDVLPPATAVAPESH